MPISSVFEVAEGREASIDERQRRKYKRVFHVVTSDPKDGPIVASAVGINLGDAYSTTNESDPGAICTSITPTQLGDTQQWHVTVEYQSECGNPDQRHHDPLSRSPVWKFQIIKGQIVRKIDLDGKPVANSAGMPYESGLPVDTSLIGIEVSIYKNPASWNPWTTLSNMRDKVNADTWYGLAANTVKVEGATIDEVTENDQTLWHVSWNLVHNPDNWTVRILDEGPYEFWEVGAGPDTNRYGKLYAEEKYGNPIAHYGLLNGEGHFLPLDTNFAVYNLFRGYDSATFAGNIP